MASEQTGKKEPKCWRLSNLGQGYYFTFLPFGPFVSLVALFCSSHWRPFFRARERTRKTWVDEQMSICGVAKKRTSTPPSCLTSSVFTSVHCLWKEQWTKHERNGTKGRAPKNAKTNPRPQRPRERKEVIFLDFPWVSLF